MKGKLNALFLTVFSLIVISTPYIIGLMDHHGGM